MKRRGIAQILGVLSVVLLFLMLWVLLGQVRNKAIVEAIQNYDLAGVQSLKARGASSDAKMDFLIAILKENPAEVKQMLAAGLDVNACDVKGNTPLIYAVNGSTIQVIKILIVHGAQVNARGEDGTTALIDAVHRNDAKIVKLLLDSGAEVNTRNDYQNTALDFVDAGYGARDAAIISQLLKRAGAKSYVWSDK